MENVQLDHQTLREIKDSDRKDENRSWDCSNIQNGTKLVIKHLIIKNSVTQEAVKYLQKWCKIDVIDILLPISCPPSVLPSLQRICKDIVFSKSSEPVNNSNLQIDGFVDFLLLPTIRVQYKVDEKDVNLIIKQWIDNKRPSFRGFYAERRGKVDKLAILQGGFEKFSSEVKKTSMAMFFNVSMPGRSRLSITYSSMCFVVEALKPSVEKDYSCMMNLNVDVELAILQQLPAKDYYRLAQTCRKWHQNAYKAPLSVKPVLKVENSIQVNGELRVFNKNLEKAFSIGPKDFSQLEKFQKIECDTFMLTNLANEKEEEIVEIVRFLLRNRDRIVIRQLNILFPVFLERHSKLLLEFYALFPDLLLDMVPVTGSGFDILDEDNHDIENGMLSSMALFAIEKCLTTRKIHCDYPMDPAVINDILKQWIRGERPNFQLLKCYCNREPSFVLGDLLEDIPEKYVFPVMDPTRQAVIHVPGLLPVLITCKQHWIHVKVREDLHPFT